MQTQRPHPDDTKFTERVVFLVPPRFPPLYDYAAERRGMTLSEWIRAALASQLGADGVDVSTGHAAFSSAFDPDTFDVEMFDETPTKPEGGAA